MSRTATSVGGAAVVRPVAHRRCPCGGYLAWYPTEHGCRLPFDATLILPTEDPDRLGWIPVRRIIRGQEVEVMAALECAFADEQDCTVRARLHDYCDYGAELLHEVFDQSDAQRHR